MQRSIVLLFLVACASRASSPPPPPPSEPAPPDAAERQRRQAEGLAAYERKDWLACARLFEQAEDWYSAACCRALGGESDKAFALLAEAIEHGFRDAAHLDRDPDLAPLRGDARWQGVRDAVAAKLAAYRASINGELLALYEADQGDRSGGPDKIDWKIVGPRDEARRKRVDEIVAAGGAKAADDYYHAAMVFQHGAGVEEIRRARELALKAVEIEPKHRRARWLAAAAEDRVLMFEQKPQKWGTQYTKRDGVWILWDVDPAITDAQRAEWDVPPLAAAKARAAQMNAPR